MSLKIGIIGSRGIPNRYGGFEQLAQHLAEGLVKAGHTVWVYSSHKHPYKSREWNGVQLMHCYDAEHILGTAGQFIYDRNCIRHARKEHFDVLLFLGYTSSSVWGRLFPKDAIIISNMDGLEWKRTKYSRPVRAFLKYAEKLAVKHSDFFVADSAGIKKYLWDKYGVSSEYIAYGADILDNEDKRLLVPYHISPYNYYMLMARMEPENNIEMILDGFHNSNSTKRFVVVGNTENGFGSRMKKKYITDSRILFTGPEYNEQKLHTLRCFASLYFHGHSVGGTNPSLLEAMASRVLIAAHANEFNRAVLEDDGYYFTSAKEVQEIIEGATDTVQATKMKMANLDKIKQQYNWAAVTRAYDHLIRQCHAKKPA